MSARLIVRGPGEPEQDLGCPKLATIGRVDSNDIIIRDPKVSRNHAMIRALGDGRYYVMDVGSANGTVVNGRRILVPSALSDGDEIAIGEYTIRFCQAQDNASHTQVAKYDAAKTIMASGSVLQNITVLVMDIRNYVALSDQISTNLLANVLGCWFQAANTLVDDYGGVVDKFIGDAVMARWVAEEDSIGNCVRAAIRTVHAMRMASDAVTKDFPDLPSPLRFGAGLATGEAALGTVGGGTAREYTALGDSVNLAFRLESSSKDLNTDMVLDYNSYTELPENLYAGHVQTISVRGKVRPLDVCVVTFDEMAEWLAQMPGG